MTISGTPTAAGTETFTVTATDTVGDTTSINYSIRVNPAISFSPSSLPADTVDLPYNQTLTASGGTGGLTLAVANIENAIPGLTVDSGPIDPSYTFQVVDNDVVIATGTVNVQPGDLAVSGSITMLAQYAAYGTLPLYTTAATPPATTTSPSGDFSYDDVFYVPPPLQDPVLDEGGLLFAGTAGGYQTEINLWGTSPGNYSLVRCPGWQ